LNICVAPATPARARPDPPTRPCPGHASATSGGQIEANDLAGNDFGSPITIMSRDLLLRQQRDSLQ
jgi:hypothetical protein